MGTPPMIAWNEISVHPKLCVGTMRRALSKVHDTMSNEVEGLKKEGESVESGYSAADCWFVVPPLTGLFDVFMEEMERMQTYAGGNLSGPSSHLDLRCCSHSRFSVISLQLMWC